MKTVVNNLLIEFVDRQVKINGCVVAFRGTKSLYNEIVDDVSKLGGWYKYGITLKK
jgi:uncharacterized Zn-binding protein involved in type VI secretion